MTDSFRKDGKPFVVDNRGAMPVYVIEEDDEGAPCVTHQPSCLKERLIEGSRHIVAVRFAMQKLKHRIEQ